VASAFTPPRGFCLQAEDQLKADDFRLKADDFRLKAEAT
jgi:hypothetical protein